MVLATGSQHGLDCSPKGDRPGFVEVSDDGRTLFIPDRRGNNKIESLKNLVEDPRIGLIFFVPGANEMYRVNGHARIRCEAMPDIAKPKLSKREAKPPPGNHTPAENRPHLKQY